VSDTNKYCVFIPCYKAEATIGETLKAVQKAINATGSVMSVFIFEDCGGDNSINVAKQAWYLAPDLLHIIQNKENLGERQTTNNAFQLFKGQFDWAFIIHADDLPMENWLVELMHGIKEVEEGRFVSVWSSYDAFQDKTGTSFPGDNSGEKIRRDGNRENYLSYLRNFDSSWHISGASINVTALNELGGFAIDMPQLGDFEFIIKAFKNNYSHLYIAKSLTKYRLIENSISDISYRTNRDVKEMFYIYEKYRNDFDKESTTKMHRKILKMTSKRFLKSLFAGSYTGMRNNFFFIKKSLFKSL
jgi:glycosyltransferase involved in cell wall biosynthesis